MLVFQKLQLLDERVVVIWLQLYLTNLILKTTNTNQIGLKAVIEINHMFLEGRREVFVLYVSHNGVLKCKRKFVNQSKLIVII